MKSHFSRIAALGVLVCIALPSWAQTKVVPSGNQKVSDFNFGKPNLDAIALIGAFYNKMRFAKTCRGRMSMSRTILNKGKISSTEYSETQSSWIRDTKMEDVYIKSLSASKIDVKFNNENRTELLRILSDGKKNYILDEKKRTWSEVKGRVEEPVFLAFTRTAWLTALESFAIGGRLKAERKTTGGQELLLVSGPNIEYVFDAKSGNLQKLSVKASNETTEIRWSQIEFDVLLPDSMFQWKAPKDAKQVAPGGTMFDYDFG